MPLRDGPWTQFMIDAEFDHYTSHRIVETHNRIYNELLEERKTVVYLLTQLEKLTPGGSEFHNDPDRCLAFISDRMKKVTELQIDRSALEARLEWIRVEVNNLMGYIRRNTLNFQLEKAMDWINRIWLLSNKEDIK